MTPEVLVLVSGGLDSASCLKFYVDLEMPVEAFFVDYGQPAAKQELIAAKRICSHFGVSMRKARWSGPTVKSAGLIQGRNAFLLAAALMEMPHGVRTIALGIHSGTEYRDCSDEFVKQMAAVIGIYDSGVKITIGAPFLEWNKGDIFAYARSNDVPIEHTYSCEIGTPDPCGECQSCIDRNTVALHAE